MEKLENYQHKTNLKQIILHIEYTFTYYINYYCAHYYYITYS